MGRKVSHSFGYGLMDAAAMVRLARNWQTVPEQQKCEINAPQLDRLVLYCVFVVFCRGWLVSGYPGDVFEVQIVTVPFSPSPYEQSHSARLAYHSTVECGTLSRSQFLGARPGENHIDNATAGRHSDLLDVAGGHQGNIAYITVSSTTYMADVRVVEAGEGQCAPQVAVIAGGLRK